MADTALDLSKPSLPPPTERVAPLPPSLPSLPPDISSDSGRASTSSTSSNDELRQPAPDPETRGRDSPLDVKPPLLSPSPSMDSVSEDDDHDKSDRVAPIRPFKMYPMDAYSGSPMAGMSGMGGLSPTTAAAAGLSPSLGMPPMIDPASVSPFAMTPMTSHLLQRKRRAENRIQITEDAKKTIPVPEERKDDAYWERRRKNNEAAKRSRDARRMKEEEIAMRAAYLEQENLKLRAQVAILKNETAKLHYMLYNRM
ncbi:cell death specification protein 2-like [Haliotis rubra]|uniref:cell death specification protein 2-like n=1 Tax=Haliotis rubra TaxID=36100 RepID=UPI001EE60F1C|nr:cell death specification protein 2-like [Haliotis rubra]